MRFPRATRPYSGKVLIRADGAGGTHDFVTWLTGQRLQYSVGFGLSLDAVAKLDLITQSAWTPAYHADQAPREGRGSPN